MSETPDCVFCRIVAGEAEAHRILEDAQSLALLDINPLARGHCLVIPKRHVAWWHELSRAETTSLFDVARRVAARLMETVEPDFVCMYARGRRIPHTHLFLVPTWSDDPVDRHFNSLEGFQEGAPAMAQLADEDALTEVAELLRG